MNFRRSGLALLFLFLLLVGPLQAESARDLFDLLDDSEAVRVRDLAKRGAPLELLSAIRRGPTIDETLPVGRTRLDLQDGYGRKTDCYVIVPESAAPAEGRPVLLLLHGLGGSGTQLLHMFKDWAEKEGAVIVSPTATKPSEAAGPNEDAGFGDRLLPHWWYYRPKGFVLRALDEIRDRVRIDSNRVLLAGYSMGGFGTWNLGLRFPDRFAALVPMAGGISRAEYLGTVDRRNRRLLENALTLPIFFVHGARDRTVPPRFDRRTEKTLKKLGATYVYHEFPEGRHILPVVRTRLKDPVKKKMDAWMRKQVRDPHPRTIDHTILAPYMNRIFWLGIEKLEGGTAEIEATCTEKNTIRIDSEGVEELTVYLDDRLLDLSRPVTIIWNGTQRHHGSVQPSHEAIKKSWQGLEDPELTYAHAIELKLQTGTQEF